MGYSGYQKHFELEKFKPSKVIIATDADPDGKHIRCLILMMFLRYFPDQLRAGLLYSATPPLYGIDLGKGKYKFFADDAEYVEYIENMYCKNNTIAHEKGNKPLTKSEVIKLLYNNMHYIKLLRHVGDTFAIDYRFLEFLLYNRSLPYNKFKSTIEKAYRYVTVEKQNGITLIRGLVGVNIQTVFFNDMMLNECKPIIDLIERSEKYYILNGNKATLLDIMTAYKDTEPDRLDRYKGLGKHLAPYYSNIVSKYS